MFIPIALCSPSSFLYTFIFIRYLHAVGSTTEHTFVLLILFIAVLPLCYSILNYFRYIHEFFSCLLSYTLSFKTVLPKGFLCTFSTKLRKSATFFTYLHPLFSHIFVFIPVPCSSFCYMYNLLIIASSKSNLLAAVYQFVPETDFRKLV